MTQTKQVIEESAKNIWRSRIVNYGTKPAQDFRFNPLAFRAHSESQRNALNEILETIGWIQSVIVSKQTGNLIDGHARIEEALKKDENTPVPFIEVDLTVEEERRMLALFDPLGAMATVNAERFTELSNFLELDSAALLEVVAGLSRTNLVEVAELPRLDNSAGETLVYLSFANVKIALTDEELEELNKRFEAYVEERGTVYGFAGHILGL